MNATSCSDWRGDHHRAPPNRCAVAVRSYQPPEPEPDLLTIAEVATKLRVSRTQAYRLLRDGGFPVPVIMIGSRQMVSRYVLERFLRGEDVGESVHA